MASYADEAHTLERVSVPTISSGSKVYYRSTAFWKASAAVNLPAAVGRTDYSGLNGFDSRCCAYGVALSVLAAANNIEFTKALAIRDRIIKMGQHGHLIRLSSFEDGSRRNKKRKQAKTLCLCLPLATKISFRNTCLRQLEKSL
jgi:hypothetical protein